MDTIELKWHSYSFKEEKVIDSKKASEALVTFLEKTHSKNLYLNLEYFINGVPIKKWWEENIKNGSFWISPENEVFSNILNPRQGKKIHIPTLKFQIHQFLGKKGSYDILNYFGFNLQNRTKEEWQDFINDENYDVQLYGCSECFDRYCGYVPLYIERKKDEITWTFKAKHWDIEKDYTLTFDYQQYHNEFKEITKLL